MSINKHLNRRSMLLGMGAAAGAMTAAPALADTAERREKALDIVDDTARMIKRMRRGEYGAQINQLMANCKGVMAFPSLLKGGFIFGGEGGTGVLMGREDDNSWSDPAFYSAGSGSWGLQIGFQDSQVIMIIMSDKALIGALDTEFEVGADASATIGDLGKDFEFSTTTELKDIYFYAETKAGAFAGVSIEGSAFVTRQKLNTAYYGTADATPKGIVIDRKYRSKDSRELLMAMSGADQT